MRGPLVLAVVLAGCATGSPPASDDVDNVPIDARDGTDPPDANEVVDPPDAEPPPPDSAVAGEVTAVEMLCNDGADNDSNGQTDCADARCAWACTALMTACTAPNRLRAYKLAPLPQGIPDVSSVSATVAVTQAGAIVVAAVRFDATHSFDGDIDLTLTSSGGTLLDLTSDNGSLNDNYLGTVFLDAAPTAITAGTAPYTGNFRPEAPLSGLNGQSITGTWSSTVTDDLNSDTGTWNDLSIAVCVAP